MPLDTGSCCRYSIISHEIRHLVEIVSSIKVKGLISHLHPLHQMPEQLRIKSYEDNSQRALIGAKGERTVTLMKILSLVIADV